MQRFVREHPLFLVNTALLGLVLNYVISIEHRITKVEASIQFIQAGKMQKQVNRCEGV